MKSKHFLHANKQGFVSVYAILVLSLCLMFASMIAQRTITIARYHQGDKDQQAIELFILYHIKNQLLVVEEQKEEDKEDVVEQKQVGNEELYFRSYSIQMDEREYEYVATYQCANTRYTMHIKVNREEKYIVDVAYVD